MIGEILSGIWGKLDNKKTAIGATSFLLWVSIYAMPAFTPHYNAITMAGTAIRDAMLAAGINLDNTLFNVATGGTALGLLDKWRKFLRDKDSKKGDLWS